VFRGRIAPTSELAIALTRRETTARGVARRLAGLAGPRRRGRAQFVRAALDLAFAESIVEADAARPSREILRRVAVAATLDPTADVLVVDDLPELGDPDFPRRCRDRLAERLAAAAGVVITSPDLTLISDFCSHAVWIDGGRVARRGPTGELIAALVPSAAGGDGATDSPPPRISRKPMLHSFDACAAIHSVVLLRPDGSRLEDARPDDWITLRVEFETAITASVMVVVRFIGAETLTYVEQSQLGEGAYIATLRLPPGAVPAGEYAISAGLVLEHSGRRTKVGRRRAAQIRVGGYEENFVLAAEAGAVPSDARPERSDVEWSLESVLLE
jgi:hypothetical protein